jgi:RNA polymerase sigma-70 factor (ECF subfamily)
MNPPDSFLILMARLKASDDAAAGDLFQRFAERLMGIARLQIAARLRHKVDPEDVVQSVFKSFFLRNDQFQVQNWDSLWGLLTLITVRKCIKHIEREQAARRDARREVSLTTKSNEEWPLMDREPSPEEGAMLAEVMEELLGGFDADDRAVLELSLQGHGAIEISARLGRAERTVRRLREQAKSRLQGRLESSLAS